MPKGSSLPTLLRRIQRRLRLFAALEGAVVGGAISALALALWAAIQRGVGGVSAVHGLALRLGLGLAGLVVGVSVGVVVGAFVRGLREIPLDRCARLADAALDGQDRVLSALHLERESPPPLVAALIADAVGRAQRLAPERVVPTRRPRGLAMLFAAAGALGVAWLLPIRSRAARELPETATASRRAGLTPDAVDVEREAARAALTEAARRGDRRLAALAEAFARTVRGLSSGEVADGEALEALRSLAARAAGAARDAERDRRAAAAATRALDENPATRVAGRALSADEAGSAERARAELGASAEAQPKATARALAAAAQGLAASSNTAGESPARPRRLSREATAGDTDQPPMAGGDADTRRLEQLRRDLDQTATACRVGDPDCRARAASRADDLSRLAQQGAAADGLRRLERAADQLRARLGRGELRGGDAQAARRFARAADGQSPTERERGQDEREGRGAGSGGSGDRSKAEAPFSAMAVDHDSRHHGDHDGDDDIRGDDTGASAAQAEAAGSQAGQSASTQPNDGIGQVDGEGIGKQAGGAPLGARDDRSSQGHATETHLATGEGPNRAEVIGSAAGRGFVARGYARVYSDYAAAVEDALGTTAVPEGKRFIVRRYFDLIRPRSGR